MNRENPGPGIEAGSLSGAPARAPRVSKLSQNEGSEDIATLGRVEVLSTDFAKGYACTVSPNHRPHVFAVLNGEVIGSAAASIHLPEVSNTEIEVPFSIRGFLIAYDRPISAALVTSVNVFVAGQTVMLPYENEAKVDRVPPLRVFILGSPRSGTSELGATLARSLGLAWLGECHAAPLFARAADAMSGDVSDVNEMVRFMAQQAFRQKAIEATRQAYFYMHGSTSFVDKTPGVPMIKVAPYLNECFGGSRFIFLRRNPVANLLSRMIKFGGNFEEHCRDWAAAMNEWLVVRESLPHYLELQQEQMFGAPEETATLLAKYIGVPEHTRDIFESLKAGSLERTGVGLGKTTCDETGWTPDQVNTFETICRPVMKTFGYP